VEEVQDTRQHGQKDRWKAVEGTGGRYRDKQHAAKHTPSANYTIAQGVPGEAAYTAYGGVRDFIACKDPEVIIHGEAETGKSLGACWKLHIVACKYPNASLVILRKTLSSTYSTIVQTFKNKVLSALGNNAPTFGDEYDGPIEGYGGEKPQWFQYPNGSRIWVAGMDKSSKILSAEHDMIYWCQLEEASEDEWQICTTRTTGRSGNTPYPQTIGDMNPAYPGHWSYQRKTVTMFYSFRTENPLLYDQETGDITAQGKRTEGVMDGLTGVLRTRLRDGKPAQVEGAVYPGWDERVHVVEPFPIPDNWRRFRAVDFGFVSPMCIQWWALDEDDRMFMYREVYMSRRIVQEHADQIIELERWYIHRDRDEHLSAQYRDEDGNLRDGYRFDDDGYLVGAAGVRVPNPEREPLSETTVCDHDAEGRAVLEKNGLHTTAAIKAVSTGIQAVMQRLQLGYDGKPKLGIFKHALVETDQRVKQARRPTCTKEEFLTYVWHPSQLKREDKEIPLKVNDHGADTTRYAVVYVDGEGSGSGESFFITPPDIIDTRDTDGW